MLGRFAALAAPAIGAGIGFTSQAVKDKWFDDDDEVTKGDYAISGGLGALTGGAGSLGRMLGLGLGKAAIPGAARIGASAGWGGRAIGGLGMLGSLAGPGDGEQNLLMNGIAGMLGDNSMGGGVPAGGGGLSDILKGGMYGGLGPAPVFNKSLDDYMGDPTLVGLANNQIIQANSAIGRENRDIRTQMVRDSQANTQAGRAALDQIGQIRRENAMQNREIENNANANQQRTVREADQLASDVGASIIADDHTRHDVQAEQARHAQDVAARQAADSQLLERMATASQDALGGMAGAEAMATKSNADNIRTKAIDMVQTNRGQAADNWLKKPEILGTLADTAMQRDLQSHQMALQSWGARLDALNSFRQMQLEQQSGAAGGMDPQMLNSLLSLATTPTGVTYEMVGEDGMTTKYAPKMYDTNPQLQSSLNQIYGSLGIPNAFTSTPVPQFGG